MTSFSDVYSDSKLKTDPALCSFSYLKKMARLLSISTGTVEIIPSSFRFIISGVED